MRIYLVVATLALATANASAQIGDFPSVHRALAVESAKILAQCEIKNKVPPGETSRFLAAVEVMNPKLYEAQSPGKLATLLLTDISNMDVDLRQETCDKLLASTLLLPSEIACIRESEIALKKNKDLHAKLFSDAMEQRNGAKSCLGMCASRPSDTVRGTSSCNNAPRGIFEVGCIEPHGPAQEAGIREGDELVSIDGRALRYPLDFEVAVLAAEPKQKVRLETKRAGKTVSHIVSVGVSKVMPGESEACQIP